jgi:hypothetical protein
MGHFDGRGFRSCWNVYRRADSSLQYDPASSQFNPLHVLHLRGGLQVALKPESCITCLPHVSLISSLYFVKITDHQIRV